MYEKLKRPPGSSYKFQTMGPNLFDILEDVAGSFGVSMENAMSKKRAIGVVAVKRIYCYVSTILTDASLKNIAALLSMDHTTAIKHRDNCIDWLDIKEPSFLEEWIIYTTNSIMWKSDKYKALTSKPTQWSESEWLKRITDKINSNGGWCYSWEFHLETGRPVRTIRYNLRKLVKKGSLVSIRHSHCVEYLLPE